MANGDENRNHKGLSVNTKWSLANTIVTLGTAFVLWIITGLLSDVQELREFKAQGDRFTKSEAVLMEARIKTELSAQMPPRWMEEKVQNLQDSQKILQTNQQLILAKLNKIEALSK